MPSREVSIRAIETERYQVIDENTKEILEEIEESKAFFQVRVGDLMHLQDLFQLYSCLTI